MPRCRTCRYAVQHTIGQQCAVCRAGVPTQRLESSWRALVDRYGVLHPTALTEPTNREPDARGWSTQPQRWTKQTIVAAVHAWWAAHPGQAFTKEHFVTAEGLPALTTLQDYFPSLAALERHARKALTTQQEETQRQEVAP